MPDGNVHVIVWIVGIMVKNIPLTCRNRRWWIMLGIYVRVWRTMHINVFCKIKKTQTQTKKKAMHGPWGPQDLPHVFDHFYCIHECIALMFMISTPQTGRWGSPRKTTNTLQLACWLVEKGGWFFIYHQRISDTYLSLLFIEPDSNPHIHIHLFTHGCYPVWVPLRWVRLCNRIGFPRKTPLEGLLLLQQAWGERDICNFLADRYKLYTKTLYVAQLICSWLVVLFTQLSFSSFLGPSDSVFLMSVLSGSVVSLEGILRPKPKWHALRKGTFSLESLIWCLLANIFVIMQLPSIFAQQSFKQLICHHEGINPCSESRIDHWYSMHVRIGAFASPTFLREWKTVKRIASRF